jgi:hypothetical protein
MTCKTDFINAASDQLPTDLCPIYAGDVTEDQR